MPELDHNNALQRLNDFVESLRASSQPTDTGQGRGIVICGGGPKYSVCLWVCVNMLRRVGCTLPIQLWHLGSRELSNPMRQLLEPLGVECVDAEKVRSDHPVRTLNGWELKPFAIMHSRFRDVLLLDADNVPLRDPEFLFETPQYCESGAIFWPDFSRLKKDRSIWKLTGIAFQDEPEFESGQIAVDKARCWNALSLTMWMNEHSDFWYRHIHGDKETFHLAWRKLGQAYAMPARGIHAIPATMCQHDFDGKRLFQHRNLAKWTILQNRRIPNFELESECLEYVDQLFPYWRDISGLAVYNERYKTQAEREIAEELVSESWLYDRVGHDRRPISFQKDGLIGVGAARLEVFWDVRHEAGASVLDIQSQESLTCRLHKDDNGTWKGRWEQYERMPIEVRRVPKPAKTVTAASRPESHGDTAEFIMSNLANTPSGFFLEIGAADGPIARIARRLVDRGWSGLLMEAIPERFWRLEDALGSLQGIRLINAQLADRDGYGEIEHQVANGLAQSRYNHTDCATRGLASEPTRREVRLISPNSLLQRMVSTPIAVLSLNSPSTRLDLCDAFLSTAHLVVLQLTCEGSMGQLIDRFRSRGFHEIHRSRTHMGYTRESRP